MESQSQKIINILRDIIDIMESSDEIDAVYYHDFFQFMLGELNKPHDVAKISENILKAYGGMGTFNDVTLYKGEVYLEEEQSKFRKLRTELFLACEDVVAQMRK